MNTPNFLPAILGQLSLLGKLTAGFGTVLVLGSIASSAPPEPVKLLLGVGFLLFTASNGSWQERHRPMFHLPNEPAYRWYHGYAWGRIFLALVYLIASVLVLYAWVRLPAVTAFLQSNGVRL